MRYINEKTFDPSLPVYIIRWEDREIVWEIKEIGNHYSIIYSGREWLKFSSLAVAIKWVLDNLSNYSCVQM